MTDDWKVGDLALCIKIGRWTDHESGNNPEYGSVYKVSEIWSATGCDGLALVLEGLECTLDGVWQDFLATRFRKIHPDTEPANADDAAWLKDLLKRPVKEPVQ